MKHLQTYFFFFLSSFFINFAYSFDGTEIVGGKPLQDDLKHKFNGVVKLLPFVMGDGQLLQSSCTGFFVNKRLILTAAHCISSKTLVLLSEFNEKAKNEEQSKSQQNEIFKNNNFISPAYIRKIEAHPGYFLTSFKINSLANDENRSEAPSIMDDLGIIHLKEVLPKHISDIIDTYTFHPIMLAEEVNSIHKKKKLEFGLLGFGKTEYKNNHEASHYTKHHCIVRKKNVKINDKFNIITYENDNCNIAPGDSGGPSVIEHDKKFYYAGIHSYIDTIPPFLYAGINSKNKSHGISLGKKNLGYSGSFSKDQICWIYKQTGILLSSSVNADCILDHATQMAQSMKNDMIAGGLNAIFDVEVKNSFKKIKTFEDVELKLITDELIFINSKQNKCSGYIEKVNLSSSNKVNYVDLKGAFVNLSFEGNCIQFNSNKVIFSISYEVNVYLNSNSDTQMVAKIYLEEDKGLTHLLKVNL